MLRLSMRTYGVSSNINECVSYLEAVSAGQKDAPELPVLGGVVGDVTALHTHGCALHGVAILIHHEPVRAAMSLSQVLYHRLCTNKDM